MRKQARLIRRGCGARSTDKERMRSTLDHRERMRSTLDHRERMRSTLDHRDSKKLPEYRVEPLLALSGH
jgi:hypothetical protein